MGRENFFDSLRIADRSLARPRVSTGHGLARDTYLSSGLDTAEMWLTARSVEGFDPADFADWPEKHRLELANEVAAFRTIAQRVPSNKPATKTQSNQARKHLERVIRIVRDQLLPTWLGAQERMMDEATKAARAKGWYVEKEEKDVLESLLGAYKAPRLRIRTENKEVVLDPIACFGSGRQGVVDLAIMPRFETKCLIVFKDGHWNIVSLREPIQRKPFTQTTLVSTINKIS